MKRLSNVKKALKRRWISFLLRLMPRQYSLSFQVGGRVVVGVVICSMHACVGKMLVLDYVLAVTRSTTDDKVILPQ